MKRARGTTKSRSGCRVCKDRRIKCDESRPECHACVRSNLKCPGYIRPLRWSRKHEMHASAPMAELVSGNYHGVSENEADAGTSSESHHESLSNSFFEASSKMSDWMDLNLDEADVELAYQDATALLSHNFTTAASSGPNTDALALEPLTSEGSVIDNYDNILSAPFRGFDNRPTPNGLNATGLEQKSQESWAQQHSSYPQQDTQGPRALLRTFYRLSSPKSLHGLSDEDFVHYYFKHVCRLHSCFDSNLNAFRSLSEKWWSTCQTVSLTIQSMAIAHIANWYPYIAPLGAHKRNQAWRSLQKDLQLQRLGRFDLDKALLCLFQLGISASWQHCSHLGLQYLYITRNLVQTRIKSAEDDKQTEGLSDFWASALIYWEMLASFVDPVPLTAFDGHGLPILEAQELLGSIMPHPWTGVTPELYFAVAEVARVARRRRKSFNPDEMHAEAQFSSDLDRRWLQTLENLIVATNIPDEALVEDYGDTATSKTDLIRAAKACRGVGLLEAYRLCPQLLDERIHDDTKKEQFPFTILEQHQGYVREIDWYLSIISLQTINLMAEIPLSSGACQLQPLLLTACASYLRFPDDHVDTPLGNGGEEMPENITQYRYILEARMFALSKKLPQRPILKAIDIIKEVWDRLDDGGNGHWIDVIHEKGWQTILA